MHTPPPPAASTSFGPTVSPLQLDGEGEVTYLAATSEAPVHRLLAIHADSGASIWDLRAQQLLAVLGPSNARAPAAARASGPISSACWLPRGARGDLVTGHAGGDINVWALPAQGELQPALLAQLRVAPAPARPVLALDYVAGRHESVLVFGGQAEDCPDGLVLLPLPERKVGCVDMWAALLRAVWRACCLVGRLWLSCMRRQHLASTCCCAPPIMPTHAHPTPCNRTWPRLWRGRTMMKR